MPRKRLTEIYIDNISTPKTGRVEHWDTLVPGFGLRITETGARSWTLLYRHEGKPRRMTFAFAAFPKVGAAREHAREALRLVQTGKDPAEVLKPKPPDGESETVFKKVAARFIKFQRDKKKRRRWEETERILNVYVIPEWGGREIATITRGDVNALLDKIADGKIRHNGEKIGKPVMADRTLAVVGKLFRWHAVNDSKASETFVSPVVPGMNRTEPVERDRVLSDEEVAAMWPLLDGLGTYGAICKVLLLTGQRLNEIARLKRSAIGADGIVEFSAASYKTDVPHFVPLPKRARAIIDAQPVFKDENGRVTCDYIFSTRGRTAFSGFSRAKRRLDKLMLAELRRRAAARGEDPQSVELKPWRVHDFRRSARTWMSRAGVPADHAEITLGHTMHSIRRRYDRHEYASEKLEALEKLGALIETIVSPPTPAADNVVALSRRR